MTNMIILGFLGSAGRHQHSGHSESPGTRRDPTLVVVARIMASKDAHVLILGTCEYVTSHDKRGFAGVMTLRLSRWDIILVGPIELLESLKGAEEGRESEERWQWKQGLA